MMRVGEESSPTHDRHLLLTSMSRGRERLKLALVTIITVNLEQMYAFYQEVRQVEPQMYRGTSVECPLGVGTLALWRRSESVAYRVNIGAGSG
jgi:hypothetical protein